MKYARITTLTSCCVVLNYINDSPNACTMYKSISDKIKTMLPYIFSRETQVDQTKGEIHERRCTLCNNSSIQDEFYIFLCCVKFASRRKKFINPYK